MRKKISAPFAASVLSAARKIVDEYNLVLGQEDGEWYGHALEYPEAMGEGASVTECVAATRQALLAGVATMLEAGERPPRPAREGKRTAQVNVRLTAEEKAVLESRSRAEGFRGVSDFIRAAVLARR